MVRANTDSHAEGIVVARKPRWIKRRPQAVPTTTIVRSAKRNFLKIFMPAGIQSLDSWFFLFEFSPS
jgi:hypothetical protein